MKWLQGVPSIAALHGFQVIPFIHILIQRSRIENEVPGTRKDKTIPAILKLSLTGDRKEGNYQHEESYTQDGKELQKSSESVGQSYT